MTRKNSYDAIRLFAASLVILSHSFAVTGHEQPSIGQISLGTIGVWVFFILSGYLIAKSWDQYPRFNIFFAKRALRIFPGLIVAVITTVAATGLFFTTLPLVDFVFNQGTWTYLNNILLLNTSYVLPGAFENNIYPLTVNGSLWTLFYEFVMYLSVALIGVLRLYKKIPPVTFWIILFALSLLMVIFGNEIFSLSIFYLTLSQFIILGLMFFSGVMAHKYEEIIKLSTRLGVVSLGLFIVISLLLPSATPVLAAVFLAYAVFSLGKSSLFSNIGKFGDFSYGLYIYSFPIQQMIAAITQTTDVYKMFALSFVLSLIIAVLSWHFVESRALRLKSKINPKRYPLDTTDDAW